MAKRCGGAESRRKVLQQTDEREGFRTNRSAEFSWNLTFQGKMWKPDEVNGSNKGLHWPPRGQQPWGHQGPCGAKATQPGFRQRSHPCWGRFCGRLHPHPQPRVRQCVHGCPSHRARGTLGQLSSGRATGTYKDPSCSGCSSHDSNTTLILKYFPPSLFKIKQKALTQANFLPVKREHCQRVWTPVEILLLLLILCVRCLATLIISDSIRSQRENRKVNTVTMSPG